MIPIVDYHIHTPLCGHALGEPYEYADHALKMGLTEIGFSDHAPFVGGSLPGITMEPHQLPDYHTMIERVKESVIPGASIILGDDYLSGNVEEIKIIPVLLGKTSSGKSKEYTCPEINAIVI